MHSKIVMSSYELSYFMDLSYDFYAHSFPILSTSNK